MPNRSKANAKRKRLATKKLYDRVTRSAEKDQDHRDDKLDQQVAFGMPGNLGSGNEVGSAKNRVEAGQPENDADQHDNDADQPENEAAQSENEERRSEESSGS